MKRFKSWLMLVMALVAASTWSAFTLTRTGPLQWKQGGHVTVMGAAIGMTSQELHDLHVNNDAVTLQYDAQHHLCFVSGTGFMEDGHLLANSDEAFQAVLKELGTPYLKTQRDRTEYAFYQDGGHWAVVMWNMPSAMSRMASVPQFGLAANAAALPTEWGRDLLAQSLPRR